MVSTKECLLGGVRERRTEDTRKLYRGWRTSDKEWTGRRSQGEQDHEVPESEGSD